MEYKEKTKEMFYHGKKDFLVAWQYHDQYLCDDRSIYLKLLGFDNYMKYAFPLDELNPIQCSGRGPDRANPNNWGLNDVLGNFSMTLVDSLDTLAIMGDQTGFERAILEAIRHVSFDVDSRVQVFEVTIRMLGGLLSAHLLATNKELGYYVNWYRGELLMLAKDLGDRLMPAFKTKTGIPLPRVNLQIGVLPWETNETCTAGAGTLLLEFGTLSRLTGDPSYERVARRALVEVWRRRSKIDLVGNTIDAQTGKWIQTVSGVGAGVDSFFEYMMKAYVLFGDEDYLKMFKKADGAVQSHISDEDGYFYRNVNMENGVLYTTWVDSLSAFYPGLQVLAGDVDKAIKGHQIYYAIWRKFRGLPERFDFHNKVANVAHYPLRPELAESTYFLYTATKNPYYLEVGAQMLRDLNATARTSCGFASLASVGDRRLDDRMESFFLSETLKYLYLLFDTDNILNKLDSNFVFTTDRRKPKDPRYKKPKRAQTCPSQHGAKLSRGENYTNSNEGIIPSTNAMTSWPPLPIEEMKHINHLIGLPLHSGFENFGYMTSMCDPDSHASATMTMKQQTEVQEMEITLNAPDGYKKLAFPVEAVLVPDGIRLNKLDGIKFRIRLDGSVSAYEIIKVHIGDNIYSLPHNQKVQVPKIGVLFLGEDDDKSIPFQPWMNILNNQRFQDHTHLVRFRTNIPTLGDTYVDLHASPALFGPSFTRGEVLESVVVPLFKSGWELMHPLDQLSDGCSTYSISQRELVFGNIVLVKRGGCTFAEKALRAEEAGAVAIIIATNGEKLFIMTGYDEFEDPDGVYAAINIPAVLVSADSGVTIVREVRRLEALYRRDPTMTMEMRWPSTYILRQEFDEDEWKQATYENGTPVMLQFQGRPLKNLMITRGPEESRVKSDSGKFKDKKVILLTGKKIRGTNVVSPGQGFSCLHVCPKLKSLSCGMV
ncbi:alpha mannosidase-like protein [Blyttiomyces sp. JEL0837]|nr:alpha mannosidase-like protein [Blyttiomyces sp. JEL0837]